jgi:type I restriction enzyme R subunit
MGKRSLYDNLENNELLALQVDEAVMLSKEHGWIGHHMKEKEVRNALRRVLNDEMLTNANLEIVKLQDEYK